MSSGIKVSMNRPIYCVLGGTLFLLAEFIVGVEGHGRPGILLTGLPSMYFIVIFGRLGYLLSPTMFVALFLLISINEHEKASGKTLQISLVIMGLSITAFLARWGVPGLVTGAFAYNLAAFGAIAIGTKYLKTFDLRAAFIAAIWITLWALSFAF